MTERDDQNLPATQEPERKALSPAEQQKAKMAVLIKAVEDRSDQLRKLLGDTGIDFGRFVEVFRRALIKGAEKDQTNLLLADAGSVIQACIDACTAGVLPDGKKGAIVCYNTNVAPKGQPKRWAKRAQFQMMYEGMLEVAYASGNFRSIMATVVYDVDEWDYGLGIDPWIKHKPGKRPPRPDGPAYEVIAAYAVAKTTNGGVFVEVFEPEDIRKVMAVSKATSGPAKDWPEQMARKGPLRRMWKFLPRDARMDKILDVDNDAYDQDLLHAEEAPKEERKLRPGFAARPALTQSADLVMEPLAPRVDEREHAPSGHAEDDGYGEMMQAATPPSDPAEKTDTVDESYDPEPFRTYDRDLKDAASWSAIKALLRKLIVDPALPIPAYEDTPWFWAWERFDELRQEGERADFIDDPLLFECWIIGAGPDPDAIEGNWRIVAGTEAWKRASQPDRERIAARVEASRG